MNIYLSGESGLNRSGLNSVGLGTYSGTLAARKVLGCKIKEIIWLSVITLIINLSLQYVLLPSLCL